MAHRSPWSQRALMALAGTGALLGYLLASGAAAPVVQDVVAMVSPAPAADVTAAANGTTLNGKRVALSDSSIDTSDPNPTFDSSDPWMETGGKRPEWSPSRLVPQGPTGSDAAQPPSDPGTPLIQVPEDPKGRNLFNQPPPMRRYDMKPREACPQSHGQGLYVQHFGAVPGTGSATVSWYDLGDPDSTEYQVDAVPTRPTDGSGSPVITQIIAAPKTCKDVSLTFNGLISGDSYFFLLTATNTAPEQDGLAYRVGRGQSSTITIN